MRKKENNKLIAISQIYLIVMGLFAFGFVIGESGFVVGQSAAPLPSGSGTKDVLSTSFSSVNSGILTEEQVNKLGIEGISAGASYTFKQELKDGVLQYYYNDEAIILTDAKSIANVLGIDISKSAGLAYQNTVNILPNTLGSLSAGDSLSNGLINVVSVKSVGDETTVVLSDAFGKKYTITGTSGQTLGEIASKSASTTYSYDSPLLGKIAGIPGHLVQGAVWALGIVSAIQFLGPLFGLRDETVDAATKSSLVGVAVWKGLDIGAEGIFNALPSGGIKDWIKASCVTHPSGLAGGLGWCSAGIGFAAGLITFLLLYSEEEEKVVTFTCVPWQAPVGGNNCEECNKQGSLGCSEYQCRSLGQACNIINPGTSEEKCVWVNRQDVNPPTIEPLQEALLNDYRYAPDGSISPPDRGVKINYLKSNDNCIPAFTPLQFGVKLNEPAACRVDVLRKGNFSEMSSFMSSGLLRYNHTYTLSLPGKSNLEQENITLINNGNYALYVRCQDANGNSNPATFVFKYCVDPGPDTTPPLIVTTSIVNNNPIAFNQSSVDLEVYTNEPASCRWSRNDQGFDNMENSMQCSASIFDINAQSLYKCSTTLTGLKNNVENKFYFRCKDQPLAVESSRNANAESYVFTLKGTQPLVIDSAGPNETTVKDSTSPVKVTLNATTSAGFSEGKAICYYSPTGNEESYIKFFETDSFKHFQDLFLTEGSYNYFIKCTDLGGNSDYEKISFDVETDTNSPSVVRAYKEDNYLKLVTSEPAQCVYSTFGCNYAFSEGTIITAIDEKSHFTDWTSQKNFYVKCEDDFGNQPLPDQCSIIVRTASTSNF